MFPTPINQFAACSQAAVLTGPGRSAVAVIGVRGPGAIEAIECGFAPSTPGTLVPGQIRYGVWYGPTHNRHDTDQVMGESVVLTPITTHEFEIHCHGGPAAAAKIIDDLSKCQVETIDPALWSASQTSLLIAEAQQMLVQCVTARTAAIALDQVRGALLLWCQGRLHMLATIRHDASLEKLRREFQAMAQQGKLGTRLGEPFRVVLVGPPNVGKSSLVNAIVGYDRSITMDAPGTTRDVLHAETIIDGLPIRLSDTAGMHASIEAIEQQGIVLAKAAASAADLVILVSDPHHHIDDPESLTGAYIKVLNKVDLIDQASLGSSKMIHTVATSGHGVAKLMESIASVLGASMPGPGTPVAVTPRQVAWLQQAAAASSVDEMSRSLESLLSNPQPPTTNN